MKKSIITILIIIFLPIIAYALISQNSNNSKTISNTNGKPQIIKFTSSMCLDCQKMNTIFKEIMPEHKDKMILTEIHIQNKNSFNDKQIEKYNVTLVPTIILIDKNGKQIKRIEGAISKKEMEKYLKGIE